MTVPKITNINIEGKDYPVETLSMEVQALVDLLSKWNQKVMTLKEDIQIVETAIKALSNQIAATIQAELNNPVPDDVDSQNEALLRENGIPLEE